MNILMLEIPTNEADGSVPFGVLYAASSVYRAGHNVKIVDLVKEKIEYAALKDIIKDFSPAIIGVGGITASYKCCRELINKIKRDFDGVHIIAGGVISSVTDLLLGKAGVDIVVRGESENIFPELVDAIEKNGDISEVRGISFLENGEVVTTSYPKQIADLDEIPFPELGLLDMSKYLESAESWGNWYFKYDAEEYSEVLKKLSGKKLFPIITARGCPYKCIFCYRHHRGWRQHSVDYVIRMMLEYRDKYNVGVFQINDELTTLDRKWVMDFCDRILNEELGVYFIILSSRVDNVDEEILKKLKQAGCLMINYGYESGSDSILKEINKGVTREQALQAGLMTKKAGIKNIPEIIIGFPSETEKTVEDTIDFLKQLDTWPISTNTPIPFPETSLWDHAIKEGLIEDKEEFVAGYKRHLFLNFTKYSDKVVFRMLKKVIYDTKLNWLRNRKRQGEYLICLVEKMYVMNIRPFLPDGIQDFLKKVYRRIVRY